MNSNSLKTSQRIFSRCIQHLSASNNLKSSRQLFLPKNLIIGSGTSRVSRNVISSGYTQCRCYQTEGDKDLFQFLQEEIAYEQENTVKAPDFHDFTVKINGTKVNFFRDFKGERVNVLFDINENDNVDEALNVEEGEYPHQDEVNLPEIISYPHFEVKITKPSGRTLHFHASYNKLNEDETEQDPEEQFDLIRFDNLKIYDESQDANVYESETENMDGELYSMLMTTLLERGITGAFVNDLLDFSTAMEHKLYVNFLSELKNFTEEK